MMTMITMMTMMTTTMVKAFMLFILMLCPYHAKNVLATDYEVGFIGGPQSYISVPQIDVGGEGSALTFTMWVKHVRKTPPVPMRIIHLGTTGSVNDDIIILETDGASNRLRLEHRLGHGFHRRLPGTFSVQ